jgi:hypothetical protein
MKRLKVKIITGRNPTKREARYFRNHGFKKDKLFEDNSGNIFYSKSQAQLSSFVRLIFGCLQNGFPICVKHLHYNAWAFYPFFFLKSNLKGDPAISINHERIHCRQQMEIHLCISLPIAILLILTNNAPLLVACPFIPTILYYFEWLRVSLIYLKKDEEFIRRQVCFEREAESHSTNLEYLGNRKWFAWLGFMGIKLFSKLGETKR